MPSLKPDIIESYQDLSGLDPRIDSKVQYQDDIDLRMRFEPYKYARDGRQIHHEIADAVQLEPGQTLLDAGCASGDVLLRIAQNVGPQTRLIGLDINDTLLTQAKQRFEKAGVTPPELIKGGAAAIELPDDSVDVVVASMMLYHVNPPESALEEFRRVLKPGGMLLASTSGKRNKERHRAFERIVAAELGVEAPVVFSSTFDLDVTRTALTTYFDQVIQMPLQQTEMVIDDTDKKIDYLMSLETSRLSMNPRPGAEWRGAIRKLVEPIIDLEITEKGYFADTIERGWFACLLAEKY